MSLPQQSAARAVVFDLDGTLADSVGLIEDVMVGSLERAGHPADRERVRACIGRPLDAGFAELTALDISHDDIAALVVDYRANYFPAVEAAGTSLLIPGVREMLHRLKEAGYLIGVVTAKMTVGADHLLRQIGVREEVDVLIGTERVEHGKPAPDAALLALAELGVAAAPTWYVGDAATDMLMAHNAGMRALAVTTGASTREALEAAGAEVIVDSPTEIAEVILG